MVNCKIWSRWGFLICAAMITSPVDYKESRAHPVSCLEPIANKFNMACEAFRRIDFRTPYWPNDWRLPKIAKDIALEKKLWKHIIIKRRKPLALDWYLLKLYYATYYSDALVGIHFCLTGMDFWHFAPISRVSIMWPKSRSPRSVSCVAALKIIRCQSWDPSAI